MNTHKKLIAFDLDGTLAESRQPMDSEMGALLSELATKYIVAVISGGAFLQFEKQLLPFLKGDLSRFILLPTNGGHRYEYDGEWKLVETFDFGGFDSEIKEKVKDAFKQIISSQKFDIPINPVGEYVSDRGTQITFAGLGQEAAIDDKKKWDADLQKRKAIKVEFEKMVPEVDAVIAGTTSIDVLPKGFNKAAGLKRVLEQKHIDMSELLFVGDSVFPGGNDYSPLEAGIETLKISGPAETKEVIKGYTEVI